MCVSSTENPKGNWFVYDTVTKKSTPINNYGQATTVCRKLNAEEAAK
jgi:hypothetical protein